MMMQELEGVMSQALNTVGVDLPEGFQVQVESAADLQMLLALHGPGGISLDQVSPSPSPSPSSSPSPNPSSSACLTPSASASTR